MWCQPRLLEGVHGLVVAPYPWRRHAQQPHVVGASVAGALLGREYDVGCMKFTYTTLWSSLLLFVMFMYPDASL
jgi:hypothetical protein